MKHALIGGLSVLAVMGGLSGANPKANINPNVYPSNTSGPYGSPSPWEWHAGPGPERRGSMGLVHTDINPGYGGAKPSAAPKAAAAPAVRHRKKKVASR